ncbi:hypothetical protein ACJX0J_001019, partial (mitochondrion) [Zea mays]
MSETGVETEDFYLMDLISGSLSLLDLIPGPEHTMFIAILGASLPPLLSWSGWMAISEWHRSEWKKLDSQGELADQCFGTTSMCTLFSGQEALPVLTKEFTAETSICIFCGSLGQNNIFRSSPNHLAVKWKERISILRDLLIYPLAFKEWNITKYSFLIFINVISTFRRKSGFLTLFVWGPIFQYGYWLRFHFHVIDFSYGNVSFFPWGEQARTHAMIAVSTLLYIPLHIKARAIV